MNAITAAQENIIQLAENPANLLQAWQQLQVQHQGPLPLRARDAAIKLGVTEAQIVATRCGQGVTRLKADWREFIEKLPTLGNVIALVRNEYAVHDCRGAYGNISFEGPGEKVGVVHHDIIDQRIFLYRWSVVFAVQEVISEREHAVRESKELGENEKGLLAETAKENERFSFQFFDKHGVAILKVFLLPESNKQAFHELVERYIDPNQETSQVVEKPSQLHIPKTDTEINSEVLRTAWSNLKETHDFYPMIKKMGIERLQALRLAGSEWAQQLHINSVKTMLETASKKELPIMVFVGNDNILQIYTGKIKHVKTIFGWLSIMEKEFVFHLWEEALAAGTAWIVRKPTVDGIVTALEVYDKNEELIVTFFGKRKPGIPEDLNWRELAESLVG